LKKIVDGLRNSWREGDKVVIAGPGNTKLALATKVASEPDLGGNYVVVEGFDLAGADGVRGLIKFDAFQQVARDSVLVEVQSIVNELIRRMARGDTRVAYTLPRVREAATAGAVESCVVTDDVFARNVDEEVVVEVLNGIEGRGGKVYLCDSSLETGKQVSSFGGIMATLRYPIKSWQ
jgi:stalled ribosome rescue protein Dom34